MPVAPVAEVGEVGDSLSLSLWTITIHRHHSRSQARAYMGPAGAATARESLRNRAHGFGQAPAFFLRALRQRFWPLLLGFIHNLRRAESGQFYWLASRISG